ncbi:hypothetical protein K2X89_11155, partial [Myxococcota bacterium]|nr:hypothetical protein [Myxococcota bacterium]
RSRRCGGLVRFEALRATRWRREAAYAGILVDQAREAASFRETAQRNAQRFRRLERIHLDLKRTIERDLGGSAARAGGPPVGEGR